MPPVPDSRNFDDVTGTSSVSIAVPQRGNGWLVTIALASAGFALVVGTLAWSGYFSRPAVQPPVEEPAQPPSVAYPGLVPGKNPPRLPDATLEKRMAEIREILPRVPRPGTYELAWRPPPGSPLVRFQELLATWVVDAGGTITMRGPSTNDREVDFTKADKPLMPGQIRAINLSGSQHVHGEDLDVFCTLGSLRSLDLSGTELSDDDLKALNECRMLELSLANTGITDAGIQNLGSSVLALREIDLTGTKVSQAKIQELELLGVHVKH